MADADLTGADFSNAFLYGLDLSSANANTKVNGTIFSGAVLFGANFSGASFGKDALSKTTTLDGAWLQAVSGLGDLRGDGMTNVSLSGAYVDFGILDTSGNPRPYPRLAMLLTTSHTQFRGWTGSRTPCVYLESTTASSLPTNADTMTCPDGQKYSGVGCGALQPRDNSNGGTPPTPQLCNTPTTNPKWCAGSVTSAPGGILGWYRVQSTYEERAQAVCNGQAQDTTW